MSGPPKRDYPLFVHSEADDLPLDVYAFRVWATIVRRAGDTEGQFYESVPTMAKRLGMSTSRAQHALRHLEAVGIIAGTVRTGQTTRYRLLPRSAWRIEPTPVPGTGVEPSNTPQNTPTPVPGTGVPRYQVPGTPVPGTDKGSPLSTSLEGSPTYAGTEAETEPASEPHGTPLPRRRTSSNHPKRVRTSKAKGQGASAEPNPEHAALIDTYNQHRGPLPEAAGDAATRRRLAGFVKEHGEEAASILGDGTCWAARDKWHAETQNGLRYLLEDGRALDYAQRWRNTLKRAAEAIEPAPAPRTETRDRKLPDPSTWTLEGDDVLPIVEKLARSLNGSQTIKPEPEHHPDPTPPAAPPKPKLPKQNEAERRAHLERQAEELRRQAAAATMQPTQT